MKSRNSFCPFALYTADLLISKVSPLANKYYKQTNHPSPVKWKAGRQGGKSSQKASYARCFAIAELSLGAVSLRAMVLTVDYRNGFCLPQADKMDTNIRTEEQLCILNKTHSYILVIFQMFRVWFTNLPRQSGKAGFISEMTTKRRTYFNYIKSKKNLRNVFNQP